VLRAANLRGITVYKKETKPIKMKIPTFLRQTAPKKRCEDWGPNMNISIANVQCLVLVTNLLLMYFKH